MGFMTVSMKQCIMSCLLTCLYHEKRTVLLFLFYYYRSGLLWSRFIRSLLLRTVRFQHFCRPVVGAAVINDNEDLFTCKVLELLARTKAPFSISSLGLWAPQSLVGIQLLLPGWPLTPLHQDVPHLLTPEVWPLFITITRSSPPFTAIQLLKWDLLFFPSYRKTRAIHYNL